LGIQESGDSEFVFGHSEGLLQLVLTRGELVLTRGELVLTCGDLVLTRGELVLTSRRRTGFQGGNNPSKKTRGSLNSATVRATLPCANGRRGSPTK
uniref:Uncharacterized protein n=1 Tax=Callorhinchus milii TaxID=7868 RepID=A0A4W3GX99_CALMI